MIRLARRILLRTPIERIAAVILASSIVAGFATMIEPRFSLNFRRGLRPWKVVPYLCRATWFRSLADKLYLLGEVPTIAALITMTQICGSLVFLPVVASIRAVCDPAIARSVIFLVGLPSVLLAMSCRLPRLNAVPGANALLVWVITTSLSCILYLLSRPFLHWAVSDISLPLYLAVLATVLAVGTVQEQLSEESLSQDHRPSKRKIARKACYDLVIRCSLYMLASVASIWIITASDTTLAVQNMMGDADHLVFRRSPFPWECRIRN